MEARTPTRLFVAVLAVVLGVALASCSGGGDDEKSAPATTTLAPKTTFDISLGEVAADSAGAAVTISGDQSQRVLDALTTYVKGATVQPLRTGKPATADFGAIFDASTLTSAMTTDPTSRSTAGAGRRCSRKPFANALNFGSTSDFNCDDRLAF